MKIQTKSGIMSGSKRSRFMKWLQGRVDSGAWTGYTTIEHAWKIAQPALKLPGASAYVVGYQQGISDNFHN